MIERDADDVTGVLYLRDLARLGFERPLDAEGLTVGELVRPAVFVPDSMKADALLRQMQLESNHLAMVVDEYGGIAGLVTLEDLIEELVGDISDEYDREAAQVEELDGGRFRVNARLPIDELGELFGLDLEDEDVDSAGGLLDEGTRPAAAAGRARQRVWPRARGRAHRGPAQAHLDRSSSNATRRSSTCRPRSTRASLKEGTIVAEYRAGFVSIVGRPNVGKSTLTNALVGEKVAITSSKPQTTRRAIRGIVHREHGQLILVDTPGLHRPRTLLGERLNSLVKSTLGDVDVIAFCVPANEAIGPGDRFINEQLDQYPRAKKVAIVTKTDAAGKARIAEQLLAVSELREWSAIIPVSAPRGEQLDVLVDELLSLMPVSEQPLYPAETSTDEDVTERISELIREAALEGVSDELPHSIAVTVDDMIEREDKDLLEIYANLFVERDSQKGIIIGKGGSRLREVGTAARGQIEALLGRKVHLALHVKVAKDWQRDPKQLGRLGF